MEVQACKWRWIDDTQAEELVKSRVQTVLEKNRPTQTSNFTSFGPAIIIIFIIIIIQNCFAVVDDQTYSFYCCLIHALVLNVQSK